MSSERHPALPQCFHYVSMNKLLPLPPHMHTHSHTHALTLPFCYLTTYASIFRLLLTTKTIQNSELMRANAGKNLVNHEKRETLNQS